MNFEEKLINLVKEDEILFNLKNAQYKNFTKKDQIWVNIAAKLYSDARTCKKKWKNLRDQYRRCKQKLSLASGSGADVDSSTWKYFDSMKFLDNYESSRSTIETELAPEFETELAPELEDDTNEDLFETEYSFKSGTVSPSLSKKRGKNDAKDNPEINAFLKKATKAIDDLSETEKVSSTKKFMCCMAEKIDEANLPRLIKIGLENEISQLIFSTISKIY